MHKMLREDSGRTAMTILVKIMPSEGKNSLQRHLWEYLSKAATYDDLEEELLAELYRREGSESSAKSFNQLEQHKGHEESKESEEVPRSPRRSLEILGSPRRS